MIHTVNLAACIYATVWIGLIILFIVPFEIWATINVYKYRYHPGLQTRYPNVIMGSAIFAIIHSLICEQFYYLKSGIGFLFLNTPIAEYIAGIVFPPFLLSMLVMIVFRIYIIHYETNLAIAQSTRDWQSLLCDTIHVNDFYSRCKSTYGNPTYVYKYFLMYIIIGSIIGVALSIFEHPELFGFSHNITRLVYVFFILILVLFAAYLFLKTPKFEDQYFVREELKAFIYLLSSCMALYVACILLSTDPSSIFNQISTSALTLANFGQVLISEHVILNKIKAKDDSGFDYSSSRWNLKAQLPRGRTRIRNLIRNRIRTMSAADSYGILSSKLFNVLIASPVGINFFVKHMRSEWCIENLLCFIELTQWIYISTKKDFQNFNLKPLYKLEFILSTAIPESSANHQTLKKWEQAIQQIYRKYIHSSAEYQVNLPYETQIEFANLINLLKIRQQIMNRTYTLKHQATKRKKILFWTKKDKQSSRHQLQINTILITLPNITPLSSNGNAGTPGIVQSKNNNKKAMEMATFPKHSLIDHLSVPVSTDRKIGFHKTLSSPMDGCKAYDNNDIELKISKTDDILMDAYKSYTNPIEKPCMDRNTMTLSVNTENVLNEIFGIDVDEKKAEANLSKELIATDISHKQGTLKRSVKNGQTESSPNNINICAAKEEILDDSLININDENVNNLYLQEVEEIEMAKKLNLEQFVSIACQVIHVCLQLNYQSVTRFKKSQYYAQFLETCNVNNLVTTFGDKGAYM